MKKIIPILIFIATAVSFSQSSYHNNQLYVKTISENINPETLLKDILPVEKVKPILNSFKSKKANSIQRNSGALREVQKIYTIYFSEEIDENKIAGFLSDLKEIEYAEPVPISRLVSEPN